MIVYSIDPPFETNAVARETTVTVTAYDTETRHFWFGLPGGWQCGTAIGGLFNPPPPIPVAARKPQVGEVWVGPSTPAFLVLAIHDESRIFGWCRYGCDITIHGFNARDYRPATPEEAEPFRPFMEVLMRSLGEKGNG